MVTILDGNGEGEIKGSIFQGRERWVINESPFLSAGFGKAQLKEVEPFFYQGCKLVSLSR